MISYRAVVAIFAIGGLLFFLLDQKFVSDVPPNYDTILETEPPDYMTITDERSRILSECRLPDLDPWDPTINPFLNANKNPMKDCKPSFRSLTELRDGEVQLVATANRTQGACQFRCLYPKGDFNIDYGKWLPIDSSKPDCDVVEVQCTNAKGKKFYKNLHVQVYKQKRTDSHVETNGTSSAFESVVGHGAGNKDDDNSQRAPDVHVILFDSVSSSQFFRAMPRRQQAYTINKSPFGETRNPEHPLSYYCQRHLDNETFIGFDFQRLGYRTLMSEDWALGVFNWPNCYGFKDTPVEHYMRPFQIRLEGHKYKDAELRKMVYQRQCREPHEYNMDYLTKFIDAYEHEPKFSITWMSYVSHDDTNGLYHVDDGFYRFLRAYKEKLRKSYLIVMGDHGLRFGRVRATKVGATEDNNPFLFVAVPEKERSDMALMRTLKENSRQLVSHYDIYATMADVCKMAANTTVLPPTARSTRPLIGSSLMRPLRKPRNCGSLRIPFDYCICEYFSEERKNKKLAVKLSQILVDRMNDELESQKVANVCTPLHLDARKDPTVEEFEPRAQLGVYRVSYQTAPGGGRFWGYVQVNITEPASVGNISADDVTIISEKLPRLNAYKSQSFCTENPRVKSYCYCKGLVKLTKVFDG
ncbi:Protein K03A11.4 [Aphelenchoides avenae]|nr:Protein K03A11.4 [Aphelenchus avenae]